MPLMPAPTRLRDTIMRFIAMPGGLLASYGALIVLALWPSLHDGFDNDAIGYVSRACWDFSLNPWTPYVAYLPGNDTGHPLIICYLIGWLWRLGLPFAPSAHVVIWLCAALALSATHQLAREMLREIVGEARAEAAAWCIGLMLFVHPLFIGGTAQLLTGIPNLAFCAAYLLATVRRRPWASFVWGAMLTLTRITGFISVAGVLACLVVEFLLGPKPRKLGDLLRSALPHIGCLFVLGCYAFGKLVILHRPMRTLPVYAGLNTSLAGVWEDFTTNMMMMFNIPRFGLILWFWAAVLGLIAAFVPLARSNPSLGALAERFRRWMAQGFGGSRWRAYALMLSVAFANHLFYTIQWFKDLPYYFLMFYPLILIAGFEGLLRITRGQLRACALLAVAWSIPRVIQWNNAWTQSIFLPSPGIVGILHVGSIEDNLSVRERIAVTDRIAKSLIAEGDDVRLIGVYPTLLALVRQSSGYMPHDIEGISVIGLSVPPEDKERIDALRKDHTHRWFFPITTWDFMGTSLRLDLPHDPRFRFVRRYRGRLGNQAELYQLIPDQE